MKLFYTFLAQQEPNDCLEFSESLKTEIILQKYFENDFPNFQPEENNRNKIRKSTKSNEAINNNDEKEDLALEMDYAKNGQECKPNKFADKCQVYEITRDYEVAKIAAKPKCYKKSHSTTVSQTQAFIHEQITARLNKSREIQESPKTCKFNETNSQPDEFKDCLTDSDELVHPKGSEQTAIDHNLKMHSSESKTSSKSDTFIRELNENLCQLQELSENSREKSLGSCEDLRLSNAGKRTAKEVAQTSSPLLVVMASPPANQLLPFKMCPSKRKKFLRQKPSCKNAATTPMKAFMWPLSTENLEICGVSSTPSIRSNGNGNGNKKHHKLLNMEDNAKNCHTIVENIEERKLNEEIKVIKEPPQLKRNRSFTVM